MPGDKKSEQELATEMMNDLWWAYFIETAKSVSAQRKWNFELKDIPAHAYDAKWCKQTIENTKFTRPDAVRQSIQETLEEGVDRMRLAMVPNDELRNLIFSNFKVWATPALSSENTWLCHSSMTCDS